MPASCLFCFFFTFSAIFLLGAPSAFSATPVAGAMDASILPAPDAAGKWGYVDAATGKTLIAPQFSRADFFYDGAAIVSREYPDEPSSAKSRDGHVMRRVPGKDGIIDTRGKEILPPLYVVRRANTNMYRTWDGRFIPRLFLVEGGEGKSLVLHADKGVIVPAGTHADIRFTPEGAVFCDGVYFEPDGTRHAPPAGCAVAYVEPETGLFRLRKGKSGLDQEGVMRRDGSLLVPVAYDDIQAVPRADVWLASRKDSSAVAGAVFALLTGGNPEISKDKDIFSVDVYDVSGKVLRSFRACDIPDARQETYLYTSKGRDCHVDARTGAPVPERDMPADAANGFRPFKENGKYGIKNADGATSAQPVYGKLHGLGGGLFAATREDADYPNNMGVIDGSGREIIPFIYRSIQPASYPTPATGPLECSQDITEGPGDPHWLIDRTGRFVTPRDKPYQGGYLSFNAVGQANIWRDGKHGVIDYRGNEVLPCVYETVFDELELGDGGKRRINGAAANHFAFGPKDALYRVERDNLWGLYDGTGKELIPIRYGFLSLDSDGLGLDWAKVEDEKRQNNGLANFRTGQTIAPEYGFVRVCPGFFLAWMQEEDKDGYSRDVYILLDKKGREFTRYRRAEWFGGVEVLAARQGKSYALLDKNGKALTSFRYESISGAEGPFVWGTTETGRVLLDGNGKEYRIK